MTQELQQSKAAQHIAEEQARVSWPERIIVHLQEHLYVVARGDQKIVKCDCGHEFGHYRTNWKYNALVYDRNPRDIYPGITGHDPDWCVYREFYCPGCCTLLEVEAVPHGVPFLFSTELDLE